MRQDTQTLKGRNLLYPCKPQATREVPEVVQDLCRELEALMEQFRATGQRLPSSFQSLVGHSFGQLKGQQMPIWRAVKPVPAHYVQGSLQRNSSEQMELLPLGEQSLSLLHQLYLPDLHWQLWQVSHRHPYNA